MGFSYGTQIAISKDATKAVQDFVLKDPVWAAGVDLKWETKPVLLSSGTGPNSEIMLFKITFGKSGAQTNSLVVTPSQTFLMPNKTLKQAQFLIPGDELMSVDGTLCTIFSITEAMFKVGIQIIATSIQPTENLDGHLLLANGVVVGDYTTEINP